MARKLQCWCGSEEFSPFSSDYALCQVCGTLLFTGEIEPSDSVYRKEYWFENQREHGLPDIAERARDDIIERCLYWLQIVLSYKLPPGKALELGSSHGGFVALLRQAGFDGAGLELSPWIVDFARQTFGAPMLLGPVENQQIAPGSLDFIVLMDVLEHLPDPVGTMRHCLSLLKPDGALFIQTPRFPVGQSLADLEKTNDPFLTLLLPQEHLFLFSESSVSRLFTGLGATSIQFEPAFFSQYDMFMVVSRTPLESHPWPEIVRWLESSPDRRLLLGLLDLNKKYWELEKSYTQADLDRIDRMGIIRKLDALFQESEADRAARLVSIEKLTAQLQESAAIQAARAETIRSLKNENSTLVKQAAEIQKAIAQHQQTAFYRVMRRVGGVKPFETALAEISNNKTRRRLRRIAVDLTPVRRGGENGGAKPLALELVKRLSREIAPDIEYILFTSSDAHEELSWLDSDNVRRICVAQANNSAGQPQAAAAPPGSPALKRPLLRRFTRRIGRTLETKLPAGTYRRIYRLYRRQVDSPKINNLVRSLDVDLVFCPFTAIYYYAPEIPVAVIVHDLQYLYYPQFFSPELNYHTSRNLLQVFKLATRIICVSEYTRQTVLKEGEVDPDRVITIPSAIFTPLSVQPEAKVAATLDEFHLSAGEYVFFPANFWRHKNHTMLLTAFFLYCQKHPESRLQLVFSGTPGPRMQFLQEATARMMLTERVVFAGFVEPEKLAALFQGCLAVIFPSLFEGFGAPVLEGMHFSKPVLCSNLTSLPEVGGDAVLYFDPRRPEEIVEAIERIVNEPDLVKELVLKGQQQVSRFGATGDWAQKYLAAFDETIHSSQALQNTLIGMFPDRWVGSSLEISISAATSPDGKARHLELDLNVPPWFPNEKVTLQFQGPVLQEARTFNLRRGQPHKLSLPLLPQAGMIQVHVDATISPKEAGINDDIRQVSFTLLSCQIKAADQSIELV
jgi:glycosyltransferase involved in cell wall biosynthesis/2-polyprenyl-3-methyl-5-hydroxy-6-metoxy-1,4-benzoquinol methylase